MALLFLSVDKLARIPNANSPLARVLRRYNVSNIKSFCGVSIFELCPRNLVTSPSVAHARASVLEYLRTPSQELNDDETGFKEFDVTSNFTVGQNQSDDDLFFGRMRSSDSDSSSQPQRITSVLKCESVQLSFVDDLLQEADIKQRLPTNYYFIMDMYGRFATCSKCFFPLILNIIFEQSGRFRSGPCIIILVLQVSVCISLVYIFDHYATHCAI